MGLKKFRAHGYNFVAVQLFLFHDPIISERVVVHEAEDAFYYNSFGIRLSINLRAVTKVDSRSLPPVAPRLNLALPNPAYFG